MKIPNEPIELKKWMISLKKNHFDGSSIDWDSYVVWAGNKLPKYLWDEWKADLKPSGFTWQKLMKLLRYRTDRILLWHRGAISWEMLIKEIINFIESPFGIEIAKKTKKKTY